MLRLVSDEDVNGRILRGLRRRELNLDIVRVQDVGLRRTPDPDILEWAAVEGRILLTSDASTMLGYARRRVQAGQPMPGVLVLRKNARIGPAINDILLVAECYTEDEMKAEVIVYIPL